MAASAIALQGLQQAEVQLNTAASAIANAGASSGNGATLDIVSLSEEMVAMMSAQTSFSANLATLETTDQMQQNLLDVTA
jgi:flagellar basal body rod protein FlgC